MAEYCGLCHLKLNTSWHSHLKECSAYVHPDIQQHPNTGTTFDSFLEEEGITIKGKKFDNDKPDLSLIPKEPLWELARVLMAGANKYGSYNWMSGIEIRRLTAAAMRHITQFNDGEDVDEETKTSHLLNASANLFFAYWMLKNKPELDNRRKNEAE